MAKRKREEKTTDAPHGLEMRSSTAKSKVPKISATLDHLQSKDYREVLKVGERLRSGGLGFIFPLPQLVVCGDQSAGKSSVLEAITEVPFPRKENLCTRYATEITMRRSRTEAITTKIIPDQERPSAEIAALGRFSETITDVSELPALMDKATAAMGLDKPSSRGTKAFARDVLSIEIKGPGRPELTLIDLPGLIQTATAEQTSKDVKLIHDLVKEYLSQSRTIMLAVVSAKNDYANQGIIEKCRKADPKGNRTLGIVTKPDYLKAGSKNEEAWIELVQNKNINFALGWHALKNRSEDEMDQTFDDRNASEERFFSQGAYQALPKNIKGIASLRDRLSQLLYGHLKLELPKLRVELNARYDATEKSLEELGVKRATLAEQKRFLVMASAAYQSIVQAATDGYYEAPFFAETNAQKGFEDSKNMRRLRAAVQHLNQQFAIQMRRFGQKHRITATDNHAASNADRDVAEPELIKQYAEVGKHQPSWTRTEAATWVKNLLIRSRGKELPGNFNPLLMSQIFKEQSQPWETLAQAHLDRIDALCSNFVQDAIGHVVSEDVANQLSAGVLYDALRARYKGAREELARLIQDKNGHPITYDPSYTANVEEARARKTTASLQTMIQHATVNGAVNSEILKQTHKYEHSRDQELSIAEDALDSQLAYYKVRMYASLICISN